MAGEMRVSMLVELNAQRARAEAAALRAETDQLGKSAAAAGQNAGAAASGIDALGTAGGDAASEMAQAASNGGEFEAMVSSLRAAINPLEAALQQTLTAVRDVAAAEELGALTAQEAALAHDKLARSAEQIIQKMESYASATGAVAAANARSESSVQRLIALNTGMAGSTGESIASQLQHGAALDALRERFDPLFAASRRYEVELREIAEAERLGALSAGGAAAARDRAAQSLSPMAGNLRQIGSEAQNSGHYVTQLGYQTNDIMMMMAAGQNPMMLAMQQGTAVTQVFQQMKSEGKALGPTIRTSLMQMLNPMSLVTMGAIALGAYAVQALMGMREETKSVADALADVTSETRTWADQTKTDLSSLEDDFGRITPKIAAMRLEMLQLAQIKSLQALQETMKSLKAETEPGFFSSIIATDGQAAAELLGVENHIQVGGAVRNNPQVSLFREQMNALAEAKGPQQQLAIIEAIKRQFIEVTGGIEKMDLAQLRFVDSLVLAEDAARRTVELQIEAAKTEARLKLAAGKINPRMANSDLGEIPGKGATDASKGDARQHAQEMIAAGQRELELAQAKAAFGDKSIQVRAIETRQARELLDAEILRMGIEKNSTEATRLRSQLVEKQAAAETARKDAAATSAAQMIAAYQSEADIVRLTAAYGADSLEVSYARVAAEREAQVALLASQGITGTLADEAMRAWDAARGIAAVNMAAGIGAAADEAILLAANLGISLAKAIGIMGLASKAQRAVTPRVGFGAGVGSTGSSGVGNLTFGDNPGTDSVVIPVPSGAGSGVGRSRGGSGGGNRAGERDSVRALIAAEERELAILRETDPVKKELLQKSEQLAKATDKQKAKLEGLIRTRMAEKTALEAVMRAQEQLREAGRSVFVGLVTQTLSWRDALSQVLGKLADMAANSAFDMLWKPAGSGGGGSGGGGWLSGLIGSIFGKKADGGLIGGTGGPREDNHLIAVSTGEYVVNAAATAGALPLLEAINAGMPVNRLMDIVGGRPKAFADGGLVGAGGFAPSSWRMSGSAASQGFADGQSPGRRVLEQHIHVHGATGNTEIRQMVAEGVRYGVEMHDREVLPQRVMEVMNNQRVSGR